MEASRVVSGNPLGASLPQSHTRIHPASEPAAGYAIMPDAGALQLTEEASTVVHINVFDTISLGGSVSCSAMLS